MKRDWNQGLAPLAIDFSPFGAGFLAASKRFSRRFAFAFALAIGLTASVECAHAEEFASRYAEAVRLYSRGEFEQSQQTFAALAESAASPALEALARFGIANSLVERSRRSDRPDRLFAKQAIADYRAVIDLGSPSPLIAEDVRHNLELAKKLSSPTLAEPGREAPPPDAPTDEPREGRGDAVDDKDSKEDSTPGDRRTREDRGIVREPFPGLEFEDPGPLSASQATSLLEDFHVRHKARPPTVPPKPQVRRSPSDY